MSIPEKEEKRTKIPRTYDIYKDQVEWLDNSSLNKSKKIRELLDNFINEVDSTVIQNLRDEIIRLNEIIQTDDDLHVNQVRVLMAKIESQKAVIVAMGGEE